MRCFSSPGLPRRPMDSDGDTSQARWVAPFGNPRINGCSHLPTAFRSVLRPSSPLSAKASTKCPLTLDRVLIHKRPRAGKSPRAALAKIHARRRVRPGSSQGPTHIGTNTTRHFKNRFTMLKNSICCSANARDLFPKARRKRCEGTSRRHRGGLGLNGQSSNRTRSSRAEAEEDSSLRLFRGENHPKRVVEVNGIEPSTSCLQSMRSPN